MSNPIKPVDPQSLEAVTGGASTTSAAQRCSTGNGGDLLQSLTTLSNTLKDIGNTSCKSGFSMTEVMVLGMLMNQQRRPVVLVRGPFW